MQRFAGKTETEKMTVLELLQKEGIFLPAACGGRGTCGKCKVRFLSGAPEPVEEEKKKFSLEELSEGMRLACRCCPSGKFEIEFEHSEEAIEAESLNVAAQNVLGPADRADGGDMRVAVDIGTTTIAAALLDGRTGDVVDTRTCINHQRTYGADVISRIQASNDGKKEELQQLVQKDIRELITDMGEDADVVPTVIAGNTTMEHLLLGLSCETLGVAPFTPVDISLHQEKNQLILPGITTYVGADIVAGIVATGMDQSDEVCMLVDLGTNGEMAIGSRERILVASTAAGPAFEGVNISCGVAGIPGAISHVTITDGKVQYETIGGKQPVGLCGTGVLEVMYELLKEEIVDETGLMDDDYVDDGFPVADGIVFTDRDIREVQLAKSAIRAGMETLIKEFGVSYDGISRLYIAGGFGQKINLKKATGIGILPRDLIDRTAAVGNSSLKGAVMAALDTAVQERFVQAVSISQEVCLSGSTTFNDLYVQYMFFEEE
ncbi:MAG: DUF4445 domain-containing protein [Eubacterium sp.]|nr:DUF4445 domain-containing protein [Eubacterium sp.]